MGCGSIGQHPFYRAPREAEVGGDGVSVAWRNVWKEGNGGGLVSIDRCPNAARGRCGAVRTGERQGPLTHGPRPTAGGRGRGEKRSLWAGPEKKGNGPSMKKHEDFLFIQIEFKQV
jgi:hypothetical protein